MAEFARAIDEGSNDLTNGGNDLAEGSVGLKWVDFVEGWGWELKEQAAGGRYEITKDGELCVCRMREKS